MEKASVAETKKTEDAQKQFKNAVGEYCNLRNAYSRRVDALKESRFKIDSQLAESKVDLTSLSGLCDTNFLTC